KDKNRILETPPGETFNKDPRLGKVPKRKPIDKVKDDESLATQVLPVRMAVVAGAFPYKAQVNEFRTRLGLHSDGEVLTEAAHDKDRDKNGNLQFAFRFLGVVVERRELDPDGTPVPSKDEKGVTH